MEGSIGRIDLRAGDALILVDVQKDFLPGGSLPVPHGDEVLVPLQRLIDRFTRHGLPVVATRDWHPSDHCSFHDRGGPWPPHCVADTPGAEFAPALALPDAITIVSKAVTADLDAYSGFGNTELDDLLHQAHARRLFVGGLATDYCVLNTVTDGLAKGYAVMLLTDAIRAVDVLPGDGARAIAEMERRGAIAITSGRITD
ncbi:isochorismatase family protein [Aromatoleum diolicum]|uniref:nicotinamidase n=1 Tax=Aromatoleum diolicum TaxID=75796 RepID=A0ABX1QIF8_9RHOO|nr:isochorismatase family protein [Aromatoleum diolicum]NMG76945.1 isochorismatase family protein [Aromatoleum diolicum]